MVNFIPEAHQFRMKGQQYKELVFVLRAAEIHFIHPLTKTTTEEDLQINDIIFLWHNFREIIVIH